MGFPKGYKPIMAGIGRKKGVPNRVTVELKAMIEGALNDAGGRKYLTQQARLNPAAFMSLVGKLIPRDMNVSGEIRHTLEDLITNAVRKPESKSEDAPVLQ